MKQKPIGRVIATERTPTTIDKFQFWMNDDEKLRAFDVVKVKHIDDSYSYGVIENISHITDATSFLTNFISSDFGNPELEAPTVRFGMNFAEASVSFNSKHLDTPVHNNAAVFRAEPNEILFALGLDKIQNPLACGMIRMYAGTDAEINLPVHFNSKFLLGPEGAHLNISGISGLAAKTSYAMFLIKSIQDHYIGNQTDETVAFVLFNVKGRDLMAVHRENDDAETVREQYLKMGLTPKPFERVRYFIPFAQSTYLSRDDVENYISARLLKKFKYTYADDRESIEMLFADIDDPNQTMESIISKIIDDSDPEFGSISSWDGFLGKLGEMSQKSSGKGGNEISVLSWRKFKRIINKTIKNDSMFANRCDGNSECRLASELKSIAPNDVFVIDIAKLSSDKQAFVFGDAVKTIYNLKLGEYDDEGVEPPSKIVIFIDELNKYASKDTPRSSPILQVILDVTERGRSMGVILFGAEQFRSNIHARVTGNCATHAYGRTNSIETAAADYRNLPQTYKNMLTRLEQGEYLIQNPIFRSLLKIRFPKPIYKQFND